ncbi:MAG: hypothetical protein ABIP74_05210 [Candidatus Saccharimonas sp.]
MSELPPKQTPGPSEDDADDERSPVETAIFNQLTFDLQQERRDSAQARQDGKWYNEDRLILAQDAVSLMNSYAKDPSGVKELYEERGFAVDNFTDYVKAVRAERAERLRKIEKEEDPSLSNETYYNDKERFDEAVATIADADLKELSAAYLVALCDEKRREAARV